MRQINEVKAAGYDQDEIVNGVIRAMVPSLTVRKVLETTADLNLDRLLSFLGTHIEETTTTDLWSKLTSMAQSPEESSYLFVLRYIELRQKILIASRKSDVKFYKPLLDKVFCRTLERGLSSTYVVQEIRHLLRTSVSDEELIFEVTKASAAEKESFAVQSKAKKKTLQVNTVQEETNKELLKVVDTLSNKLTALQAEFKNIKKGGFTCQ